MNANDSVCGCLNVIHHIKLGLQRGAKLGLATSQTKTTWTNDRHYKCLEHCTCMDYFRVKKATKPIFAVGQLLEGKNLFIIIFLLNVALSFKEKHKQMRIILNRNKLQCDNNVSIFCFIQVLNMFPSNQTGIFFIICRLFLHK